MIRRLLLAIQHLRGVDLHSHDAFDAAVFADEARVLKDRPGHSNDECRAKKLIIPQRRLTMLSERGWE
jgi:hypothetical protein